MKRLLSNILLISICQVVLPQSNDFWKGDLINSSESVNFRVLIKQSIYNIEDTSWIEDIKIPTGIYNSIDIDKNNNIWLFTSSKINFWNRTRSEWISIGYPPVSTMFGKVFDDYVYCGNSEKIYRADYKQPTVTWELLYDGDTYEDFYIHGNIIYVAKYQFKVIRSIIGSNIWESILTTPTSPAKLAVSNEIISVGTYWDGVFTSSDSGRTWINGAGLPFRKGAEEIKIINGNEIYALVKDQISTLGWYYSNDKGKSFNKLTMNFSPWVSNQMRGLQKRGEEIFINAGYNGFYKSSDNGKTWLAINNGNNNNKPHHVKKIISTKNNEIIVLSSIGGVPLPWYMGTWGIFKSADNGITWKEISNNLFPDFMIIEDIIESNSGDIIVAPYDPGYLYILKSNTAEWVKFNVGQHMLQGTYGGSTIELLEKGVAETIYAGTFWDGLLKSVDNGQNWIKLDYGYNNRGVQYIFTKNQEIYIVSSDQMGYIGIFYSNDSGLTWQKLNDNGIIFKGIKKFDDVLFAYTRTKIFKSKDNGATWEEITENLPFEIVINSIDFTLINPKNKSQVNNSTINVFIASNVGAYKKDLNKTGWEKINNTGSNCIYYSETSKQIHFGGIESFFSQYFNPSFISTQEDKSDIYPFIVNYNSVSDNIIITNFSESDQIISTALFNNLGQKIISRNSVDICSIGMNEMKSGLYIINVKYRSGNQFAKKIVVVK
jgi:photosystem II stability/assembly factor-like uncharacterized protein